MNKLPEVTIFCNVATKLQFQAQYNYNKNTPELNSITFYYQMTLPVKIHLEKIGEDLADVFNRFEDTILGNIYGGVLLSKYKQEEGVKAYFIYDGRNYKIGKSVNPEKRLKEIKTSNYRANLIAYSEYIPEKFLHEVFAHRNVGGEWFNLLDSEIEVITKMMSLKDKISTEALMRMCARQIRRNKPTRNDIKVVNVIKEKRKLLKVKLTFGKYNGKYVSEMISEQERKYLFWAYNNVGNMNKDIKNAIKAHIGL